MKAEQYLDRIDNKRLNSTPLYSREEMIKFAEDYHKAKVEAISDEDINNRFPDSIILPNNNFQGTSKVSQRPQNTFKRFGAKWFKQQLLKQ